MTANEHIHGPVRDPISALDQSAEDGVLAVITGVDGPSYRPLGALMAIFPGSGQRIGTLSSGCIESDLAIHAKAALDNRMPARVIYGQGSPFIDIQLPCGGGLEILLIPRPDRLTLSRLCRVKDRREACTLGINCESGALSVSDEGGTGLVGSLFQVRIEPEVFFYVFGKGPEASTFASLVQSAGYPNLLLSPDKETLGFGEQSGCATQHLKTAAFPPSVSPDQWSAVVLFFHDHEWEPPILCGALKTPAFYIGAQGSQRARDARHIEVAAMGAKPSEISRLRGPIGLIPSVRDARTLAVSVLAEILGEVRRS